MRGLASNTLPQVDLPGYSSQGRATDLRHHVLCQWTYCSAAMLLESFFAHISSSASRMFCDTFYLEQFYPQSFLWGVTKGEDNLPPDFLRLTVALGPIAPVR